MTQFFTRIDLNANEKQALEAVVKKIKMFIEHYDENKGSIDVYRLLNVIEQELISVNHIRPMANLNEQLKLRNKK